MTVVFEIHASLWNAQKVELAIVLSKHLQSISHIIGYSEQGNDSEPCTKMYIHIKRNTLLPKLTLDNFEGQNLQLFYNCLNMETDLQRCLLNKWISTYNIRDECLSCFVLSSALVFQQWFSKIASNFSH